MRGGGGGVNKPEKIKENQRERERGWKGRERENCGGRERAACHPCREGVGPVLCGAETMAVSCCLPAIGAGIKRDRTVAPAQCPTAGKGRKGGVEGGGGYLLSG